jgi:hypothetical protein
MIVLLIYHRIKPIDLICDTLVSWLLLKQFSSLEWRFCAQTEFDQITQLEDRLCGLGLVVWVPGYRLRGTGFDSRRYQIFWEVVDVERGIPSIVSTIFRPPLWFSGQSSWLQIQRSGLDSRLYQSFWETVGLERPPLWSSGQSSWL